MRAVGVALSAQLALALVVVPSARAADGVDPYFSEALYYANQGQYFEALERLDTELGQHYGIDEPELDSLFANLHEAEFDVGDFELRYRMHHRAGRAIRAVIEGDVPAPVRNDAIYRLARIHFEKEQPQDALDTLDKIEGEMREGLAEDVGFLRANLLLALDRPEEAAEVLRGLQGKAGLRGFAEYNLGIALLDAGHTVEAVTQLDRAGRVRAANDETQAIRDKSNLVLGSLLSEAAQFDLASQSLDRVRLSGPFSNAALLHSGWAQAAAKHFDRAVVPWSILAKREPTDAAVQEALLALPYAYSQLEGYGRAALLYNEAVQSFGRELDRVDASIESIRRGDFLEALAREEIRQDADWVVRLRSLPNAPETFYLLGLMASHDFQTSLQNYLDLEDLRKKLESWRTGLDAYEDIIATRRAYYEPRLPEIDDRFRRLDSSMRLRLEQRRLIDERLSEMLVAPRPELLRTATEEAFLSELDALEQRLAKKNDDEPGVARTRARIARLRGLLSWEIETKYHERLTEAHKHLRELDRAIGELETRYEAFVRARQAASHSYEGYKPTLDRSRARVGIALEKIDVLMKRQGHLLEKVAIMELQQRRDRLAHYQNQARFAFADSYDRASKSQAADDLQGGGE